jgi:flagellar biosynthesis/type III secretory pathway protein FliH
MKVQIVDRGAVVMAPASTAAAGVGDATPVAPKVSEEERAAAERARADEEARTRIDRELAAAKEEAARLVTEALGSAAALLDEARATAAQITADAARQGEEDRRVAVQNAVDEQRAKFAAGWTSLRAREERSAGLQIDRTARLAGVVAQRLLGHALETDPATVVSLVRQALGELRDVRPLRFEVHPDDASGLRAALDTGGIGAVDGCTIDVSASPSCDRGSFRVHTDLGAVHAVLGARIERLTSALRDALHNAT